MKGESFLLTVAQLGLALAGFTGLFSVFRRNEQGFIPQELAGIKLIFEHSFAAVFLALLPFPVYYWLDYASEPSKESTVWLVSSSALILFLIGEVRVQAMRITELTSQGTPPRKGKVLKGVMFPVMIGLMVLQVVNIFRWQSSSAFFAALIWLLVSPGIQFYFFVLFFEEAFQGTRSSPDVEETS